jgi:hypothetical protein
MRDLRTIAVGRPKRRATLLEQLRAGLTNRSRSKTLRRILEFARRDVASEAGPVELGYLITSSIDIARPDVASGIFEPFFTPKSKAGSGLGLSASHGNITGHKGEIIVVSEPGEGTRFEVRLPICD